ncbi:MAG: NTP transferase domain-containing protein, partial [Actinomycetota bacterium]|nr:NTP transferase domain-containing protein [Actinomycetota bacterium]
MTARAPVAGAILVGGASRRFGSDKALAIAGDLLMGQRVVAALRDGGVDPVVAVGGTAGSRLGLVTVA